MGLGFVKVGVVSIFHTPLVEIRGSTNIRFTGGFGVVGQNHACPEPVRTGTGGLVEG